MMDLERLYAKPQKMKTEENANLLKKSYEDLPRKEIRLVDKEDEEIILSIPNLRQKRDFPCILYCKVHQASRIVKWKLLIAQVLLSVKYTFMHRRALYISHSWLTEYKLGINRFSKC